MLCVQLKAGPYLHVHVVRLSRHTIKHRKQVHLAPLHILVCHLRRDLAVTELLQWHCKHQHSAGKSYKQKARVSSGYSL